MASLEQLPYELTEIIFCETILATDVRYIGRLMRLNKYLRDRVLGAMGRFSAANLAAVNFVKMYYYNRKYFTENELISNVTGLIKQYMAEMYVDAAEPHVTLQIVDNWDYFENKFYCRDYLTRIFTFDCYHKVSKKYSAFTLNLICAQRGHNIIDGVESDILWMSYRRDVNNELIHWINMYCKHIISICNMSCNS
jgi:hypothetical protein